MKITNSRREENSSNSEEDDEEEKEDSVIETGDGVLNFPQRKLKDPSPVWRCAVKIMEAGGLAGVKCSICKKIFRIKDGNTTTILRHLVKQHKNDSKVKEMEKILKEKKKRN